MASLKIVYGINGTNKQAFTLGAYMKEIAGFAAGVKSPVVPQGDSHVPAPAAAVQQQIEPALPCHCRRTSHLIHPTDPTTASQVAKGENVGEPGFLPGVRCNLPWQ